MNTCIPLLCLEHYDCRELVLGGGQIFRGKYLGSVIAAKKIFNSATPEGIADFDHEVSMLTQLSHPAILAVYGVSKSSEDDLVMIMEFCTEGDLARYYKTPAFNNAEYCRIMTELLNGVAFLHQRNIAHRDLKPLNVSLF